MKKTAFIVSAQILLLLLLIAPQASTQEGCDVDKGLQDLMSRVFDGWSQNPSTPGGKIYVSHLSFMDGITKTQIISEESELIDQAVQDGMDAAAQSNGNILVNQPGHTVPNTDANVTRLAEISFNPNFTQEEKFREAVTALLEPHDVDVLISGIVTDTGQIIQIKAMGVSKPDENIRSRDMSFQKREDLFARVNGTLTLTPRGREEIKVAVKELLDSL